MANAASRFTTAVIPSTVLEPNSTSGHPSDPCACRDTFPSHDQLVFAVRPETGLTSFEDILTKKYPLNILGRGQEDHCLHLIIEDVMKAAGFSQQNLEKWGDVIKNLGRRPIPEASSFQRSLMDIAVQSSMKRP